MKQLFYTLLTITVFASCGSSKKDFLSRSDDDKTLYDAVKTLSKHPDDTNALKALPILYSLAQERHLAKITKYTNENSLSGKDKVIDEYAILQKMYDAINGDATSSRLVAPVNYQVNLDNSKQQAAEAYYLEATTAMDAPGRENSKKA